MKCKMTSSAYAKSYTEVLTILNCLDKEEYCKIPKSEIDFLKENCDNEYKLTIDKSKKLAEQNISKEANAVLVILFQKYFASEEQKERLKTILLENYKKNEEQKRLAYNSDRIFKEKADKVKVDNSIMIYKESRLTKWINAIKKFFGKV